MNTIINGSTIGKAVRAVKSVAGSGTHYPVLDMMRIRTTQHGLEIVGTNLETWINYTIETDVEPGAQVWIDKNRLAGAVKGRKGSQNIGINGGQFQLGSLLIEDSPEISIDYPVEPAVSDAILVASFVGAEFRAMIKRHKATSKRLGDTTRINLCGVNVEYDPKLRGSTWTTTDGYSLTCEEYDGRPAGDNIKRALIPMEYLIKAAAAAGPKDTVNVEILKSDNGEVCRVSIYSSAGIVEYLIHTTADEFPDFRRVIPAGNSSLVSFDCNPSELARIVSEAKQTAPEDSGAITIEVQPAGSGYQPRAWSSASVVDRLQVSSSSPAGSYSDSIEIMLHGYADPKAEPVSFNAAYLQAVAGFTDNEFIRVSLSSKLQAARFDYDRTQVAVLMPVNMDRS